MSTGTVKQIVRVLEAVQDGCVTSDHVSEYTKLSKRLCAAYLHDLVEDKLVRVIRRARNSRSFNWYEPTASESPQ